MIKVTYNEKGSAALVKNLKGIGDNFLAEAKVAMKDTLLDMQTTAKGSDYSPFKTGNLRRSITTEMDVQKTKIIGRLGSNLVYAGIQEYGGTIKPKSGKYLRFKGSNGWVSVKGVTIRGKFYLTRAIKDNMEKFKNRLEKLQLTK